MNRAKRVACMGMLFALALLLSFLESSIAPLMGLPPGVKPGLSNIVVMYALLFLGRGSAFALVVLKALFAFATRGPTAGWMSLWGGAASVLVMAVLLALFHEKIGYLILSVGGAVFHNLGQLAAASILLGSALALGYAPILLISGLGMGILTSFLLKALIPALGRLGLHLRR